MHRPEALSHLSEIIHDLILAHRCRRGPSIPSTVTLVGLPLMLTPASFRAEIDAVARSAVTVVSRPVVDAVQAVQSASAIQRVIFVRILNRPLLGSVRRAAFRPARDALAVMQGRLLTLAASNSPYTWMRALRSRAKRPTNSPGPNPCAILPSASDSQMSD
jgi:hypothetical protein